jgi:hypothetical protein
MSWFNRIKEGITTSTKDKKETPELLHYPYLGMGLCSQHLMEA